MSGDLLILSHKAHFTNVGVAFRFSKRIFSLAKSQMVQVPVYEGIPKKTVTAQMRAIQSHRFNMIPVSIAYT